MLVGILVGLLLWGLAMVYANWNGANTHHASKVFFVSGFLAIAVGSGGIIGILVEGM